MAKFLLLAVMALAPLGCAMGPHALERSHGPYNDAVLQVTEEQLLMNLVRARYNDNASRLDVSSIAAQFEASTSAEARPFFSTEADAGIFRSFSKILPFAAVGAATR